MADVESLQTHINRVKRQVEALTCQIEKAETYISQIKQNSPESVSKFKEEIESLEEYIKLKKIEKSQFSEQLKHFEIWLSQVEKELPCGESGNAKNFMEAGHGKGAPDGIGAVIKRTADTVVNTQGQDITKTADLIEGIRKYGTTIELIEIPDNEFLEVQKTIPAKVPSVKETMKLHQIVVKQRGIVSSRVLSCFCAENCECFNPQSTTLLSQETPNAYAEPQGATTETPSASVEPQPTSSSAEPQCPSNAFEQINIQSSVLHKVLDVEESLIGQYCVVEYESLPYPGLILDVDDDDLEVKVMHRIGVNRFFWPLLEDRIWYKKQKVVTLLEEEPQKVTNRHRELPSAVWRCIVLEMNLDE